MMPLQFFSSCVPAHRAHTCRSACLRVCESVGVCVSVGVCARACVRGELAARDRITDTILMFCSFSPHPAVLLPKYIHKPTERTTWGKQRSHPLSPLKAVVADGTNCLCLSYHHGGAEAGSRAVDSEREGQSVQHPSLWQLRTNQSPPRLFLFLPACSFISQDQALPLWPDGQSC